MNRLTEVVLLAALLAASTAYSQDAGPSTITAAEPDEPLYAAPTRLDRIGRILAPVMVNGRGPFRFVVDTGANQSVITTQLADALGLQYSLDRVIRVSGVTGSAYVPSVHIDTLETGELVQRSIEVPVLQTVMGGASGILGTQGFKGKRVVVDFAADRIRISRSRNQQPSRDFVGISARLRFGQLMVVDGQVGGIPTKVVIDTGAQRTLGNLVLRDQLQRRRAFAGRFRDATVMGLVAADQPGSSISTPRIRLDKLTVSYVEIIYGDIEVFRLWELQDRPAILLGMDVLGTASSLVLDYRRRELQILP